MKRSHPYSIRYNAYTTHESQTRMARYLSVLSIINIVAANALCFTTTYFARKIMQEYCCGLSGRGDLFRYSACWYMQLPAWVVISTLLYRSSGIAFAVIRYMITRSSHQKPLHQCVTKLIIHLSFCAHGFHEEMYIYTFIHSNVKFTGLLVSILPSVC